MKSIRNLLIGVVVLLVLLATMVTHRVAFNETAIVTTFGRADAGDIINADGEGAGLHFKWPWPIQDVTRTYDRGVQILEDSLEQANTRDAKSVTAQTYVAWQVGDPLAFYTNLSTVDRAEQRIRDQLRAVRGLIGQYDFDQLVNTDPSQLRRGDLEEKMLAQLRDQLADEGVVINQVGLKRVGLGQMSSEAVFNRMRATRQRLANAAIQQGDAQAGTIRTDADNNARRIIAFANRDADRIEAEGNKQAGRLYEAFRENEQLAILIQQLEQIPELFGSNTTVILDPNDAMFGGALDPIRPSFDPNADDQTGDPTNDEGSTPPDSPVSAN